MSANPALVATVFTSNAIASLPLDERFAMKSESISVAANNSGAVNSGCILQNGYALPIAPMRLSSISNWSASSVSMGSATKLAMRASNSR